MDDKLNNELKILEDKSFSLNSSLKITPKRKEYKNLPMAQKN